MNEDNDLEKQKNLSQNKSEFTSEESESQTAGTTVSPDSSNQTVSTQKQVDNAAADSEVSEEGMGMSEPELESSAEETTQPDDDKPVAAPVSTISGGKGGKKKKFLLGLLIVVLLAGLGYASWKLTAQEPAAVTKTQTQNKSVELIRIAELDGPVNDFYPSPEAASGTSYRVNNQIFEGLVKYENVSKITPLLATSWTNPDDTTWVFSLKPGVKFHTGNRMTAKDVKYSIEKYNQDAYGGIFAIDLKDIQVISDNKISIITSSPDPLLLNKLANLPIVDSTSTKERDPSNGTGPYIVKQGTTPSETNLVLVAFNQYHDGTPLTKQLNWKFYSSEDEIVKDVLAGKIDYTAGIDITSNMDKVRQKTQLVIENDTGVGVSSIGINVNKAGSPLKNLKFRQAINLALNRQQVIDDSNLKAEPAEQVVTKDIPGYDSSIPISKQNLEEAKKLLAEAGYPKGASFSLLFDPNNAQAQIDSIAKQLSAINVTVKPEPYADFDILVEKAFSGKADAYFLSYTTDLFDSSDALATLFQNVNYNKASLNELLDKASSTIDPVKRTTVLKDASKQVISDVAEIPIYSLSFDMTYSPSLNITRDTYYTTYFWQTYKKD